MPELRNIKNFKLNVLAATVLLIAGFTVWLYANSAIQGYTQLLGSSTLTQQEIWSYEGSLLWWQNAYTTIFPITVAMMVVGMVGLFVPVFWVKLQQKYAIKSFTTELELASKEKFEFK